MQSLAQANARMLDLKRTTGGLTVAQVESNNHAAKPERQLNHSMEELRRKDHQLKEKNQATHFLQQQMQQLHFGPTASFCDGNASLGRRTNESHFAHHKTAGTLHSPGKNGGRRPLASLENNEPFLRQQQQQLFGPSVHFNAPSAPTGQFFEHHKTAGTLHSPGKTGGGRSLLASLDGDAPLPLNLLGKRQPSKRPQLNSPPAKAKPAQKKQSKRPTPKKSAWSDNHKATDDDNDDDELSNERPSNSNAQQPATVQLKELQMASWKASTNMPNPASCHAPITAACRLTDGDIAMLKSALLWLKKCVPLCRTLPSSENLEAKNVVENIKNWLQCNLHTAAPGFPKKGGTLPLAMEQAVQAISSAVLFDTVWDQGHLLREFS